MNHGHRTIPLDITYRVAILMLVILPVTHSPRLAQGQVAFTPGDAFFSFRLTNDLCTRIENADSLNDLVVIYDFPEESLHYFWGGIIGVEELQLKQAQAMAPKLANVYRHMRKSKSRVLKVWTEDDGREHQVEENAPHVLVYNREADFEKMPIGLKLNEEWDKVDVRYTSFITTYDSAVEDFTSAKKYEGLKVDIPPNGRLWTLPRTKADQPPLRAAVDGAFVKLIVIESGELEAVFKGEEGNDFFQISDVDLRYFRGTGLRSFEEQELPSEFSSSKRKEPAKRTELKSNR